MKLDELLKQIEPLPYRCCRHPFNDQVISEPERLKAEAAGMDDNDACGEAFLFEGLRPETAAYLTHAANMLPKLVDAIRDAASTLERCNASEGYSALALAGGWKHPAVIAKQARAVLAEAQEVKV
jgi:hypothetical protein